MKQKAYLIAEAESKGKPHWLAKPQLISKMKPAPNRRFLPMVRRVRFLALD